VITGVRVVRRPGTPSPRQLGEPELGTDGMDPAPGPGKLQAFREDLGSAVMVAGRARAQPIRTCKRTILWFSQISRGQRIEATAETSPDWPEDEIYSCAT
jgi:hypothetical protein